MKPQEEILTRGIEQILPSQKEFKERLKEGPIRIYHGIDPTAPQIHIGHAVVLWKLKEFQDLGHKVILLIGDFTGMIGDPTGRISSRKQLTRKEVLKNARTYKEQIGKILKFGGENPADIRYNSRWLSKISLEDWFKLSSLVTYQQIIERDMFQERQRKGQNIHLHEFFYPLMQAYDSVVLDVDAEIGGTDQTFNMLVGRRLMKKLKNKEKFVITVPLLEGLDGRKMSKSFNNYIALTDRPTDMFGKVMSVRDELISRYFELATQLDVKEIKQVVKMPPMEAKKRLAWEIVSLYHNKLEANKAQQEFERTFQKGEIPKDIKEVRIKEGKVDIIDLLTKTGLASSKSEARRLIAQGGVEVDGQKIPNTQHLTPIILQDGMIVRVGKRRFVKVRILE